MYHAILDSESILLKFSTEIDRDVFVAGDPYDRRPADLDDHTHGKWVSSSIRLPDGNRLHAWTSELETPVSP